MSQVIVIPLFLLAPVGAAAAGVAQLAVSALSTTVSGVGAVTMTAAQGAIELGRAVGEQWGERERAPERMAAAPARFDCFELPLTAETEVVLAEILHEQGSTTGEDGILTLQSGERLSLDHAVFGPDGQLRFGIRRGQNGTLEAVCAGERGLREVNDLVVAATERLAVATLTAQGFRVSSRQTGPGPGYRLMLTRGRYRPAETVTLTYQPERGELRIDSSGILADGRAALGIACPNIGSLLRHFSRKRPGGAVPLTPGPSLPDGSGAASRPGGSRGLHTDRGGGR